MNKLLDLEEVVHESKRREQQKLELFETILEQCHSQIKRFNKENKIRHCKFSIPVMIPGKPPFDFEVLTRYLVYHLRDNGLFVEFIPCSNQIYISWEDCDIDLEKYEQRKNRIRNIKPPSVDTVIPIKRGGCGGGSGSGSDHGNVYNDAAGPINREKYKQAKRLQLEREHHFKENVQRKKVQTKSFADFMKSSF